MSHHHPTVLQRCRQTADSSVKTDVVKTYVDWAAKQGFGVIDVNLPKHVTSDEDEDEEEPDHPRPDSAEARTGEAKQLLQYLWDNYIELNDSTHIFFVGTNTGHGAITGFIKDNQQRAPQLLTKAISFVQDVPLLSVKSNTTDDLAIWYYRNSLVFVEQSHSYWGQDLKIRKRFGRVKRSGGPNISDMVAEHKDEVTEMLFNATKDWREGRQPTDDEDEDDVMVAEQSSVVNSNNGVTKLPPVDNYALSSPAKKMTSRTASPATFASPVRAGQGTPPVGNFANPARPLGN
jgi:histone deacetylase 6